MKASKLQFYSIAIVAANKSLDSAIIEATPIEDTPMINGELTDNIMEYTTQYKDSNNRHGAEKIMTTVTVKATWIPIGQSNRKTPPDVRRGEMVVLYRFSDNDEYWWTTLKNDNRIRRLETVIYTFVNERSENKDIDSNNSYWIEISTHRKLFHLHTSKNDGEPFEYDIQIDAKNGVVTIADDVGNFIRLDSTNTVITLQNANDTNIILDKENINMNCKDLTVVASGKTLFKTPSFHVTGNISSDSGVTNKGVNISSTHVHGGIKSGPGNTTTPH